MLPAVLLELRVGVLLGARAPHGAVEAVLVDAEDIGPLPVAVEDHQDGDLLAELLVHDRRVRVHALGRLLGGDRVDLDGVDLDLGLGVQDGLGGVGVVHLELVPDLPEVLDQQTTEDSGTSLDEHPLTIRHHRELLGLVVQDLVVDEVDVEAHGGVGAIHEDRIADDLLLVVLDGLGLDQTDTHLGLLVVAGGVGEGHVGRDAVHGAVLLERTVGGRP